MARKKKKAISEYRYIRFKITPAISDPLLLGKLFEDALMQSFGLSRAGTYVRLLWIAPGGGEEVVVRVAESEAQGLLGAVVAMTKVRISLVNDSNIRSEVIDNDVSININEDEDEDEEEE